MLEVLVFGLIAFMLLLAIRPSKNTRSESSTSVVMRLPVNTKIITPIYQPNRSQLRPITTTSDAHVSRALHNLDTCRYVVLDNLLLPSQKSQSSLTQIDHVVVSTYGIFVIETKGHMGYIYGSKQSKVWTQCKYGGVHTGFNSPTHQNFCHKQAVLGVLKGWVFEPMHSICVFPFASKIIAEDCPNVFDTDEALDYILSQRRRIYSNVEVNRMVEMLLKANKTDDYSYDSHVAELKLRFAN